MSAVASPASAAKARRELGLGTLLPLLTAVIALVLATFTWPSANLNPRDLPIGVVGAVPRTLTDTDAYDVHRYPTAAAARAAVRDREIYGALAGRTGYIATGASPAIAPALQQAAGPAKIVDLAPGTREDPRIATLASLALPLTFVGMITATLAVFGTRRARKRVAAVLAGAAIAGLLAALITQTWLNALPGSWLGIAGAAALAAGAISATITGLGARFGAVGIGLGAMLMMLIANPWSAISSAPELLPEPARTLGQLLPTGAAGELLRSVAYFDSAAIGFPLIVLGAWALAGLAMIPAPSGLHRRQPAAQPAPNPAV